MAGSVVAYLLHDLASLSLEVIKLMGGVWGEVKHIRDELERMRAFLRVAYAHEESDQEIKVWVKQLRDVVYDVEDVLEEFKQCLEHRHIHAQVKCSFCFSINIFQLTKRFRARLQITSKIKDINVRVIGIAEGHQRYQDRYNCYGGGRESSSSTRDPNCNDARGDALLLEEAELVAIDKPKKDLIDYLTQDDPALKAISVVGMGGMGKTTLLKKVFDNSKVKNHFQTHVWVTVSKSFDTLGLLKDIAEQIYAEIKQTLPRGTDKMNCTQLKATIREFLQEKRYIIVFDDVWNTDAWEALRYAFPDGGCCSRLMLTTRNSDVARTASTECGGHIHYMKPLPREEAWNLFCQKTFKANSCPSHLLELSKDILKRCEGLPIAIVSIGGLLSTKNGRIDDWEIVVSSLGTELESNNQLKRLKKILSLSYHDLPYFLQPCFLYVSLFPEDCVIKRNKLIRLWIAEGFVEEKEGQTPEKVAESYLNELVNRSLILVGRRTRNRRVSTCCIHDLLRKIALSKVRDLNFATQVNWKSNRWPEKVRRLSIPETSMNIIGQGQSLLHLRSLLMFNTAESLVSVLSVCNPMLLRVLDLEGASLESLPDSVLNLASLRYLSLRGTTISKFPRSIGRLVNLETLDLKHAHVTELPDDILKLPRLRHLLVYRYKKNSSSPFDGTLGFRAPPGLGRLTSLQKLCFIDANENNGILGELENLNLLTRLGITKLRREDGLSLCSSLENMPNLRSLDVNSTSENEILDIQGMNSPPRHLQRLWLQGPMEELPQWITSLYSLVKIRLRWSHLSYDPLESLQGLPNLVELQLRKAYDGDELLFKAGGFPALKVVHLHDLQSLKRVLVEEGAMPVIEDVIIIGCKKLEEVPSGIEKLNRVKSLCFSDMNNQLIQELQSKEGENYLKIMNIKDKRYTHCDRGRWIQTPL